MKTKRYDKDWMRHRCSMQVSSKHNKTHLLKSLDAFLSPAAGFDGPPPTPMFKKQEELRSQTCVPECCLVNAAAAAASAASLQSCPTLCDSIDGSPPGSSVPGTLQARTLEWVPISFSNAWKWRVKVKSLNHVWLFMTPGTVAHQAPPSMGFSRQEYWSGLPFPSPAWLIGKGKKKHNPRK